MVDLLTEQPDNLEFEKLLERGYNVFLFCMLLSEERIPKSLKSLRIYVPRVMFTFLREDIHAGMQLYTFEEGVILAAAGCSYLPGCAMSGVVLDRSSLRAPPNCICSSPPCPGPQAQRLKTQFGQIF